MHLLFTSDGRGDVATDQFTAAFAQALHGHAHGSLIQSQLRSGSGMIRFPAVRRETISQHGKLTGAPGAELLEFPDSHRVIQKRDSPAALEKGLGGERARAA